jgi:hypothetical protein
MGFSEEMAVIGATVDAKYSGGLAGLFVGRQLQSLVVTDAHIATMHITA